MIYLTTLPLPLPPPLPPLYPLTFVALSLIYVGIQQPHLRFREDYNKRRSGGSVHLDWCRGSGSTTHQPLAEFSRGARRRIGWMDDCGRIVSTDVRFFRSPPTTSDYHLYHQLVDPVQHTRVRICTRRNVSYLTSTCSYIYSFGVYEGQCAPFPSLK